MKTEADENLQIEVNKSSSSTSCTNEEINKAMMPKIQVNSKTTSGQKMAANTPTNVTEVAVKLEPNTLGLSKQIVYRERVIIKKKIYESKLPTKEEQRINESAETVEIKIEVHDEDLCSEHKNDIKHLDTTPSTEETLSLHMYDTVSQPSSHVYETTQSIKSQEEPIKAVKKTYTCNVCYKIINNRSNLSKHKRIHTGERPYSCNKCTKTFSQKSHLTTHLQTHYGMKPHVCQICNKVFSQPNNLKIHMRLHSGERPYICDYCDKTYTDRRALTFHIEATHIGYKPYSCNICKKKFTQKCTLNSHMKIHSGERPFTCSICKSTHVEKSNLVRHMRIHTGEKPYSCNICGKSFTQRGNLTIHKRVHVDKPIIVPKKLNQENMTDEILGI